MTESQYLTAVYAFGYFGPARVRLLLSYFGGAKNIWECPEEKLVEVGLPVGKMSAFAYFRKRFDIEKYFRRLHVLGIRVVTILDKDYPQNLIDLDGAPSVLYYKGSLDALKVSSVAIVGSRKMTPYGKEVAEKFSSELSNFGVTVISGLARGIDSSAHKACLNAGGRTVAILGNGLDIIYPPENLGLSKEIIKAKGALISEYPLSYPPLPGNFAARNRIISGLSSAIIVIEGAEKSGTLLTATHAAEQGKTLFAVPGPITSPLSAAPLSLIKNGAIMATSTKDILDELDRISGGKTS
jgi:DNA processing protein